MMHSSSFESPKPYLFGYYLKNSITALLRYVILAQSTPILLHTEGLVSSVSLSTVNVSISFQNHMILLFFTVFWFNFHIFSTCSNSSKKKTFLNHKTKEQIKNVSYSLSSSNKTKINSVMSTSI